MSETFPTAADDQVAAANLVQNPEVFSYADNVQALFSQAEEAGFKNPDMIGKYVVDGFIGQLIARDGVTSSRGETSTPLETILTVENACRKASNPKNKWEEILYDFTSNDGLRDAVNMLATDPRTGNHVGNISDGVRVVNTQRQLERVFRGKHTGGESIAMTGMTSIGEYLSVKARMAGDDVTDKDTWNVVLSQQLSKFVISGDDAYRSNPILSAGLNHDSMNSAVRADQHNFDIALERGKQAGVDIQMLSDSVQCAKRGIMENRPDLYKTF